IFIYPHWDIDPAIWWQWLFPLASLVLLAALWLVRRRWRGPLAGWLLFIGTLFPVLGFFNVYPFIFSFVADHFQYLASLGIIVLVAHAVAMALSRIRPKLRWAGNVLCVGLIVALAMRSWRQSQSYGDASLLYRATISQNPNCWLAQNNLG